MTCEQAQLLINAKLDGELSAADSAELATHLAECADCRLVADAIAEQHAQLMRGFAPRRQQAATVADRVIEQLGQQRRRRMNWLWVPLAAAAGFLLALAIFQPWTPRVHIFTVPRPGTQQPTAVATTQTKPAPSAAHLALATGKVEMQQSGSSDWHPMETGGDVAIDCRVRTGEGVRCEFICPDGSQVRLNENTELRFANSRKVDLADGQVWSGVAKSDAPFIVSAVNTTITALGTRFDVSSHEGKTRLVVLEGATNVRAGGGERRVNAGQGLEIQSGQLGQPQPVRDLARASKWIEEILVLKDRDNPELIGHVDDLLAHLGEEKMAFMYEDEIRALGDHCVLPLTRYIESARSAGQTQRRRSAAAIVADSAQPWCIPYLIELLSDDDAEVRTAAHRGLSRLTHADIGDPTDWRSAAPNVRADLVRKWEQWWKEKQASIPGPKPGSPEVRTKA